MPRRVTLLVNPAAASGRALAEVERALTALRSHGYDCRATHSAQGGHLTELALELAPTCDVLVAAGGDGTVREVASGLLRSTTQDTVLGVLPVGTGNDFATQIGIPELDAALAALTGPQLRQVDVIEVRHSSDTAAVVDHALLFAATGFAVDVLRRTSARVKRVFGRRLSYSIGFFRALVALRSLRMTVRADGHDVAGPLFHVCAGNTEWAGGGAMRLSPGAHLDDGRLELCLIQALGRFEALRCFPMLVRGTFPSHPKVRYFGGQELSVSTELPAPLALDGDVLGRTPATFRVLPGALRVLVRDQCPGSDSTVSRIFRNVQRAASRTTALG